MYSIMEKLRFTILPFKEKDAVTFLQQNEQYKYFRSTCAYKLQTKEKPILSLFFLNCWFYLFIEV